MKKNYILKNFAVIGTVFALCLTGCGKAVDDSPAQAETIETVDEEQEDETVTEEVVTDPDEDIPEEEDEPELPEPTFVQTGDNTYSVITDCPDNSDAPELETAFGYEYAIRYASCGGVSENLMAAVLAVGVENGGNLGQIDFDAYDDHVFDVYDFHYGWDATAVFTKTPENYSNDVYIVTQEQFNTLDGQYQYVMSFAMQNALIETNYNLTCALERYNIGPDAWNQIMNECMNETGMTAEQIYAGYDADFVMSFDELGLANPDFPNSVLQYISSDEEIYVMVHNENGKDYKVTYTIERS